MGLRIKDEELYDTTREMVFLIMKYASEDPKILGDALVSLSLRSLLAEREISKLKNQLTELGTVLNDSEEPYSHVRADQRIVNVAVERVLSTIKQIEEINEQCGGLN